MSACNRCLSSAWCYRMGRCDKTNAEMPIPPGGEFYASKNGEGGAVLHTRCDFIESYDKWEDAQNALSSISSPDRPTDKYVVDDPWCRPAAQPFPASADTRPDRQCK